jgi:hypothetical protein
MRARIACRSLLQAILVAGAERRVAGYRVSLLLDRVDFLYEILLVVLGIALLGGMAAWIGLAFGDKEMPEALASIVSLIARGLLGVLAPSPSKSGG